MDRAFIWAGTPLRFTTNVLKNKFIIVNIERRDPTLSGNTKIPDIVPSRANVPSRLSQQQGQSHMYNTTKDRLHVIEILGHTVLTGHEDLPLVMHFTTNVLKNKFIEINIECSNSP